MSNLPGMWTFLAASPLDHVVDHPLIGWYVSNYTVMLLFSGVITALVLIPAARRIATGPRRTLDDFRSQGLLANLVEVICIYLRDDVFKPVLHEHTDRYAPMLWTLFWFILVCNLVGLVPFLDLTAGLGALVNLAVGRELVVIGHAGHGIGGTATQSIWVTGALATVAFVFWNGVAIVKDFKGWLAHMTGGAPWFMWPIMIPVEIVGLIVKPCALAIRLFANMTGGHILLAVVVSFILSMIRGMGTLGYGMALIPLVGAVAINLLEILVAFIQAFIFTFLSTLFLGQLIVHEHEEAHDDHISEHLPHATPHGVDQTKAVPLGKSALDAH